MKTFLRKCGIFAIVFVMANLFFSNAAFGQETEPNPTVTLDQADLDYAPGETVYITGSGWKPGEEVTLEVTNLTNPEVDCGPVNPEPHVLWTTIADEAGNFTASWYVNDCELGADLFLEAYGRESGFTFEIFFTDAGTEPKINSITPLAGASGTIVTIVLNQPATTITSVLFGSTPAIAFSLGATDKKIITVTAPGGSGLVDVIVNGTWTNNKNETPTFTDTFRDKFALGCTTPTITASNLGPVNNEDGFCGASVTFGIGTNVTLGGTPTPTITYTTVDGTITSPHTFPVGTTTVTAATSDNGCGTASTTFDVTVDDNLIPTIICAANQTQTADSGKCDAAVTVIAPSFGDNCPGSTITNDFNGTADASGTYLVGTTTVVWTVTDAHNHTATCSQTITVTDDELPVITSNGDKSVNNTTGLCSAAVTVSATATDNCGVGTPTGVRSDALPLTDPYPVGTTTIKWNVTDIHTNAAVEVTQTVVVTDNQMPVAICQSITVQLNSSGNATITPEMINNGSTDNCGIRSLVLSKTAFTCADFGVNNVTLTVTDNHNNVSTCTATVTVLGRPVITAQPVATTPIVYGCDAPILSVTASLEGTGTITYQWYKNSSNSNIGGTLIFGETASSYQTPHNYSIGNYYYYVVVTANSCSVASTVATVTITPQVAAAVGDIYYTGPVMAWITSATSNTATVTLSATIKNGLLCGDIRTARITFTVNGQAIPSATNLPVGFIDPNYPEKGGTASAIVQLNIASNATSDLFEIGVEISGNYEPGAEYDLPGQVTVVRLKPGGVISGGTLLCNGSSTGYVKGISLSKSYLNFYVEYAMKGKSVTNPKGKVSLLVLSRNKPDGTVDIWPHLYAIKSNAIASLNITSPTATFSGKANIAEINLLTGVSTSIEGNCQMVLDLTDGPDQVGITIQRNGGGIWYSNNWVSTKTVKTNICGGEVNVTGTPTSTAKIADPSLAKAAVVKPIEQVPFNVIAYPNPAKYQFTLVVEGGSKEKVNVMVYDVLGRTLKQIESNDGQPILFGEELPRGAYFTIVSQGVNQKTVRLIKE